MFDDDDDSDQRGGQPGRPAPRRPAGDDPAAGGYGGPGPSPSFRGASEPPPAGPAGPVASGRRSKVKKSDPVRSAVEWVVVIAGAVLVAVIVKALLLEAFWIPSESMEPTLQKGDRVLVNKVSGDPSRGDVVVFERPPEGSFTFDGCNGGPQISIERAPGSLDPSVVDLIKRVVGVPGDEVTRNADGTVSVNGQPVPEPYLAQGQVTPAFFSGDPGATQCIKVPPGEVFVLGDNRDDSTASNVFGPIKESSIVGHAFVRIWPPGRIGRL